MSAVDELVEVLRKTQQLLARSENDFAWSKWSTPEDAVRELDTLAKELETGDVSRMRELELLFAPTGSIQEISISSGWGDEFLALAEKLDSLIGKI